MSTSLVMQRKLSELTGGRWRRLKPAPTGVAGDEAAAKLWHFRETAIFASLSADERDWLVKNTAMVTCKRGKVFYRPNETGEVVFILKLGRVDLYRLTSDGKKLVVASLEPHTIFGEMALIGQAMYGCFAEAAEDCVICVLSRQDMQTIIRRNPDVGLRLLAELGQRLQDREAELEALAFQGLPTRLASLLLKEADAFGKVSGYSHQDLAERLGTYRETVSQLLGRFRSEGIVVVEPRQIRIIDYAGLKSYVDD